MILNSWPQKIDDGELSEDEIKVIIYSFLGRTQFSPDEVILACSQFNDIKNVLKTILGKQGIIYDSYKDTVIEACKIFKIRGRLGKRKK